MNPHLKHEKDEPSRYSRNIDDTYIFDPSTGLYKREAIETEQERARKQAGTNRRTRFFIDPKTDWRPIIITVTVSLLTVALLVATVHYARLQWKEMKRGADAAHDSAIAAQNAISQAHSQFQQDARPYIWLTNTGMGNPEYFWPENMPKADPKTHGQIIWTYHFTDYGKTPAYNVVTVSRRIKVGKNSKFKNSYGFKIGKGTGGPIPPGKDDFNTAVSDPGLSRQEFDQLINVDEGISIEVVIRYTDAEGAKYETGMCFTKQALGSIQYCDTGNYIH
jgi:hypothetical protein